MSTTTLMLEDTTTNGYLFSSGNTNRMLEPRAVKNKMIIVQKKVVQCDKDLMELG